MTCTGGSLTREVKWNKRKHLCIRSQRLTIMLRLLRASLAATSCGGRTCGLTTAADASRLCLCRTRRLLRSSAAQQMYRRPHSVPSCHASRPCCRGGLLDTYASFRLTISFLNISRQKCNCVMPPVSRSISLKLMSPGYVTSTRTPFCAPTASLGTCAFRSLSG